MDVNSAEKELSLKNKIIDLEAQIEKLLHKTNYKVYESDEDRLSCLGNKFNVKIQLSHNNKENWVR